MCRSVLLCFLCFVGILAAASVVSSQQPVRYLTYEEAQPVLRSLDERLPAALKGKSPEEQAAAWPEWIKAQDVEIRARLRRGEEDSLVNFLLFGASFTKKPRATVQELIRFRQANAQDKAATLINARIDDLIKSLAAPGANERLVFLRKLTTQQARWDGDAVKLRAYLIANLRRVLGEQESYVQIIATARLQGGADEEFIERSRLYRTRGLSLDTTVEQRVARTTRQQDEIG